MLRVSSETVKTFAVCWKKSAVSCIRAINLTTEIVESAVYFVLRDDCWASVSDAVIVFDYLACLPKQSGALMKTCTFRKRSTAREARALRVSSAQLHHCPNNSACAPVGGLSPSLR